MSETLVTIKTECTDIKTSKGAKELKELATRQVILQINTGQHITSVTTYSC